MSKHRHPAFPKGKRGIPASGDETTDEEFPDYAEGFPGVQKAYEDIQEIFSSVAREYPEFLKSEDEGDGTTEGGGDQGKSGKTGGIGGHGDLPPLTTLPPLRIPGATTEQAASSHEEKGAEVTEKAVSLPKVLKPGARPKVSLSEQKQTAPPAAVTGQGSQVSQSPAPSPFSLTSSRVQSVIESEIRHDSFANEFIQATGKDWDKNILSNMRERDLDVNTLMHEPEEKSDIRILSEEKDDIGKTSSLKVIYTPPIWPYQEGLYKMLSRLPSLRTLVLDDSKLKWLRYGLSMKAETYRSVSRKVLNFSDLGSLLSNLTTLSLVRCGLKSLDGTLGLLNLENLFVANNFIVDPSPLAALQNLRYVDLSDNQISDLKNFAFLKGCQALTCIKLMENPVSKFPNFHTEMKRMIPSLRELRPRIMEIHGPSVFDLKDESEDDENLDTNLPMHSTPGTAKSSQGEDEYKLSDSGWGWREEELRLRDVYSPGRLHYMKRPVKSIPYTVDEMDALLEELESRPASTISSTIELPVDKLSEGSKPIGEAPPKLRPQSRLKTVPRLAAPSQKKKKEGSRAKTAQPM